MGWAVISHNVFHDLFALSPQSGSFVSVSVNGFHGFLFV